VWPGHILLSQILVLQGRAQEALRENELIQYEQWRESMNAMAYFVSGRKTESDAALKEFVSKYPNDGFEIARMYALRNQPDQAFQWLDRAYAKRDAGLGQARVDPFLKNLHHDARYAALLKKLNLPN
jgi:serine/threonine-protein kinase